MQKHHKILLLKMKLTWILIFIIGYCFSMEFVNVTNITTENYQQNIANSPKGFLFYSF